MPSSKQPDFREKLRGILRERRIPITKFSDDVGLDRANFFYRKQKHKHCRYVYMAIAYYLDVDAEDLVAGTDAENDWYGDGGI